MTASTPPERPGTPAVAAAPDPPIDDTALRGPLWRRRVRVNASRRRSRSAQR